jgi:hypothetical protein
MNPRASSGLKKRCKHRGIKPSLRVRRPRVAEASAEAQALREGGLKKILSKLVLIHLIDHLAGCNFQRSGVTKQDKRSFSTSFLFFETSQNITGFIVLQSCSSRFATLSGFRRFAPQLAVLTFENFWLRFLLCGIYFR